MKKITYIITALILGVTIFSSCDGVRREPGNIYMPDMAYSRAYESYDKRDSTKFTADIYNKGGDKIFYNNTPVLGTMKRGELFPYSLPNDSVGYKMSAEVKNPYDTIAMSKAQMDEAGRLFNINCAICHGAKGTANGPIATAGHVGGVANLTGGIYLTMKDGTMFHSITYGRNLMGSYASQLTRAQRWMIIKYLRTLQPKAEAAKVTADTTVKK
ncbi:MAG: cytochrome c [Ferruginibacter sp.]|nr:cytochrome c [Ferruginibacter sp.]